ncbi:MAG TPA: ABC transporter permease [Bacteroidales bacterium]|nr:MAG: ABC transporter permease [Bacteroidetes bacterium GWE2_42_24]OFY27910.1 MAG: ABC transporter permease [Bacteroidetes bacterium GWF2_43_11]HBZ68124.1 ABC transporter permease [Bacteroidales bacterium]
MTLLIGSLTIGLILALLALGIFIGFKIFNFPDITAEGSVTFGAAIAASLIASGISPLAATLIAFVGGALAGTVTGILHTRFNINGLLSGILVMTALYSVNLHVMGKSNVPLLNDTTLITDFEQMSGFLFSSNGLLNLGGWMVLASDLAVLCCVFLLVVVVAFLLFLFFRTNLGTAMRATGNNDQMIRALGVNTRSMIVLGLALSNGLIALSGAFLAQYQGFADVQMGIGMLVWGLASVIIGEALIAKSSPGFLIIGAIMGSVIFRLLVAIALRWGMNPNDLKLITAVFVFIALILPVLLAKIKIGRTNSKIA